MGFQNIAYQKDKRIADLSDFRAFRVLYDNGMEPKIVGEKGYDILINDGRKVEVKIDTWIITTGNISCEWWVDEDKKTPGWTQYSDADVLIYFFSFDWPYVLSMPKLQEYVRRNFDSIPGKYYGGSYRRTLNKMVHISTVPELRIRELERLFGTPKDPCVVRSNSIDEDLVEILTRQSREYDEQGGGVLR